MASLPLGEKYSFKIALFTFSAFLRRFRFLRSSWFFRFRFGVRVRQIAQTGGIADSMAVQDLKEIRIAGVTVDGEAVDKSVFSYRDLRDFSMGGKSTSSVMAEFRFVDENGDEIKINPGKTYIALVPKDGWSTVSIN